MNANVLINITIVCIVLIIICLFMHRYRYENFHNNVLPLLINVGLPRTGTQSFDNYLTNLGYKCAHIGYGEDDSESIAQFKKTGYGPIYDYMLKYQILSDSPYYGLIESLKKYHPNIKLVATNRSKNKWLSSMYNHKNAGGSYLMKIYNTQKLSDIYDRHTELLNKYNIPIISLEMSDQEKVKVLHNLLNNEKILKNIKYDNIDNWGNWTIFKNNRNA